MADQSFQDATLDSGHWCSRQDCADLLKNIDEYCEHNVGRLNRAITKATGIAMSILRSRWPDEWPFASVPNEIRQAVAAIAVRQLFFGQALPDELAHLDAERDWAEAFLRDVRDGDVVLEESAEERVAERIAVTGPPIWADRILGFRHAAGSK